MTPSTTAAGRLARAAVLAVSLLVAACGGGDGTGDGDRNGDRGSAGAGAEVETVATGLEVPWEIAFLPDRSALVTERPGRIRLLGADGELKTEPVGRVEVSAEGEGGLLGLALDPSFDRNRFVYLYYTTADGMRLARHRFRAGRLSEDAVVLDGIDAGTIHDSGRIAFGPDRRLYVLTGDAGEESLAQDAGSRNGKVLRLDADGYRGEGGDPEVVSLGHRNPQGLDWQPGSGRLFASEHGATGDDEINVIREGRNYGWPEATGREHDGFSAPAAIFPETIAPSGATFVAQGGSAWTGDFLVAALAGEQMRRVTFDGERVVGEEALFAGRFGRLRTVVEAPDGSLYLLTSNRDGRGEPTGEDDRILRVVPPPA